VKSILGWDKYSSGWHSAQREKQQWYILAQAFDIDQGTRMKEYIQGYRYIGARAGLGLGTCWDLYKVLFSIHSMNVMHVHFIKLRNTYRNDKGISKTNCCLSLRTRDVDTNFSSDIVNHLPESTIFFPRTNIVNYLLIHRVNHLSPKD
jgi:hypothetical protein